jgi:hypothetical protein
MTDHAPADGRGGADRFMTTLDQIPAIRTGFMMKVLYAFLALALLSVAISFAGKRIGRDIALAGHSEDPAPRTLLIARESLSVPANLIRFQDQRRDGPTGRVDLYMRWPELDGYTAAARDAFNHAGGSREIVFVTIEPRVMSRHMDGRFEPIYSGLLEPGSRPGPGGLSVRHFRAGTGYVDEVLVTGGDGQEPEFVARCLAGDAAADSLAPCERDVHFGRHLSFSYRFPANLAGEWRDLDAAVRARIESMLLGSGYSRSTSRIAIEKL